MKLILIGFATSYKTTVGKLLSQKLNIDFFDVDELVQNKMQLTVQQIFDSFGEDAFRIAENDVVGQIANKTHCVVSCGGGSVMSQNFAKLSQNATVVWLQVDAQNVKNRLDGDSRPLFDKLDLPSLEQKIQQRNVLYQPLCHFSVDTNNKTATQVVQQILNILQDN